jgi:4-hydroxybenzoate polyprenyltransferase
MDEAGIMEGFGINGLVVGRAGSKKAMAKSPDSRIWTTIIECISATGQSLQPLVVFKGKIIQKQWFPEDLDQYTGWQFAASQNGWTSDDIALEWLKKIFILQMKASPTSTWKLLIMDSHGSHTTDDFTWECFRSKIYLLFLPPHCSHVLQPLDLSIFSPLKTAYRQHIGNLAFQTDMAPIGKKDFLRCYYLTRQTSLTSKNILAGWKASGISPLNRSKPLMSRLLLETQSLVNIPVVQTDQANQNTQIDHKHQDIPVLVKDQGFVKTPCKSMEVYRSAKKIGLEYKTPESRILFRKIGKSLYNKNTTIALQDIKIQRLLAEIEGLQKKKKAQVVNPDPNDRFVDIEHIKRAKEEQLKKMESLKPIEGNHGLAFEDMCIEWSILDPVE